MKNGFHGLAHKSRSKDGWLSPGLRCSKKGGFRLYGPNRDSLASIRVDSRLRIQLRRDVGRERRAPPHGGTAELTVKKVCMLQMIFPQSTQITQTWKERNTANFLFATLRLGVFALKDGGKRTLRRGSGQAQTTWNRPSQSESDQRLKKMMNPSTGSGLATSAECRKSEPGEAAASPYHATPGSRMPSQDGTSRDNSNIQNLEP